jgi:hypothetical protein
MRPEGGEVVVDANKALVHRFYDEVWNKVVEIRNHRNDLGLMHQLGAPVLAGSSR